MASLFGKIGTGAEKVYNVTSYPIAWTQSLYGWTTDKLVLPFVSQVALPGLSYLADRTVVPLVHRIRGSASEPLDTEAELPKRPKRCGKCFDLKDLYNLCKWIKKHTYSVAHMQPTKIPDPKGLDRIDQIRNTVCGNGEKAVIQGFRIIYVIAEIGEKPVAVRLYITEMGFELRPSLMSCVVQPIFKDIEKVIAGPQIDAEDLSWTKRFTSGVRSGAGDFFKREGLELTNQHLKEKEEQIAKSLANIEGQAQDKAIILLSKVSNYMLREGLYFFVTPWLLSYITSPIVSSIGDYTGYVGTVNTVAYILSYLKYAAWAKTAFIGAKKLYESCPPELTDEVRNRLYGSFSGTTNPSKKLQKYPAIVTTSYDLHGLTRKFNVRIIELMPPLAVFIEKSDSETLRKLQTYSGNFLRALKTKSDKTLRKYDLIDGSARVEEVFEEDLSDDLDHSEAPRLPTTPSLVITGTSSGTSPKASGGSDRAPSLLGTLGKTAAFAEDALEFIGSKKKDESASRARDREPKEKRKPARSLVAFLDRAEEVTDGLTALVGDGRASPAHKPPPSSPETSDEFDPIFSPKKPKRPERDLSSVFELARKGAALIDAFTSSPATPPPPTVASAATKPVDDSEEKLDDRESYSSESPRAPLSAGRATLPPPSKAVSSTTMPVDDIFEEPNESDFSSSDAPIPGSPGAPRTPLSAGRATVLPPPETSTEPKPADAAGEEPKETPTEPPHWLRRAAVVTIVAGAAIVIGIKILNRFSLIPDSLSKFSLPTNMEDNTAMKLLSSLAKLLFHLFKSRQVETAQGS